MKYDKATPYLRYDTDMDRWILQLPHNINDGESYCMAIRCAHDEEHGWFTYRFLRYALDGIGNDGMLEVVTVDQYKERVATIAEHEGDEIAGVWQANQQSLFVVHDGHPVFALRKHWEAMMTLGLFFPSVNHRPWNLGKPLPPAAQAECEAIRERQMQEESAAMAAAMAADAIAKAQEQR